MLIRTKKKNLRGYRGKRLGRANRLDGLFGHCPDVFRMSLVEYEWIGLCLLTGRIVTACLKVISQNYVKRRLCTLPLILYEWSRQIFESTLNGINAELGASCDRYFALLLRLESATFIGRFKSEESGQSNV